MIAECNVFLAQIEENQACYDAENYRLYRGEAIALRTFLHFDLFRMFALAWSEENKTKRAIPYYDREVNQPLDYMTGEQIAAQLLADIDEAIALLAKDPILEQASEIKQATIPDATFWNFRNFRINIYAAYALKARICLHTGDNTGMKLNCTQQDRQERETSDNKTTTYERTTKFRCEIQMCICLNFVLIPAAVG